MANCRVSPDRLPLHPVPDGGWQDPSPADPCDGFDAQREHLLLQELNRQAGVYGERWSTLRALLRTRHGDGPALDAALEAIGADPAGRRLLEDRRHILSNLDCLRKSSCSGEPARVIESTVHLIGATTNRLSTFLTVTHRAMSERHELETRVRMNTARVRSDWNEVTQLLHLRPDLAGMAHQVIWTLSMEDGLRELDSKIEDLNSDSPDAYRLEVLGSLDELLRCLAPDMARFLKAVRHQAHSSPAPPDAKPP